MISACVVPAMAQTNGAPALLSPIQVAFVKDMLRISRAQISKATLAEQRATDPNEKVSAELTIAQWYAVRAHLAALASLAQVTSPVAFTAEQESRLSQLQSAPSSRVMQLAVRLEREGRENALAEMRAQAASTNPQISAFVEYAQPMLVAYGALNTPERWTGSVRTGSFGWSAAPSGDAGPWPNKISAGAFGWSTGTKTSNQTWPAVIRAGAFGWK
jgi:hypothetical protein